MKLKGEAMQEVKQFDKDIGAPGVIICDAADEKNLIICTNSLEILVQN